MRKGIATTWSHKMRKHHFTYHWTCQVSIGICKVGATVENKITCIQHKWVSAYYILYL